MSVNVILVVLLLSHYEQSVGGSDLPDLSASVCL